MSRIALPTSVASRQLVQSAAQRSTLLAPLRRPSGRLSMARIAILLGIIIVGFPVGIALAYYTLFASPVFIAEGRFVVRTPVVSVGAAIDVGGLGSDATSSPGGSASGGANMLGPGPVGAVAGASSSQLQDPFIVSSYIMSHEMVRRLDADGWLRQQYSGSNVDWLSRLPAEASIEQLYKFWRRQISVGVDRRSNMLQMRVRAFSPEAAEAIGRRVIAEAKRMITDLTQRQRQDTLALARAERVEAENRFEGAVAALRQLRRTSKIVDPAREAKAAEESLLRLTRQKIAAITELETLLKASGRRAPGVSEHEATIRGLEKEIARAKARITGDGASGTVLAAIAALEKVELERRFAQGMLTMATNVLERAIREADQRASFLLTHIEPAKPARASEPNILASVLFVLGLSVVAWLFAVTAAAITLDQIDS